MAICVSPGEIDAAVIACEAGELRSLKFARDASRVFHIGKLRRTKRSPMPLGVRARLALERDRSGRARRPCGHRSHPSFSVADEAVPARVAARERVVWWCRRRDGKQSAGAGPAARIGGVSRSSRRGRRRRWRRWLSGTNSHRAGRAKQKKSSPRQRLLSPPPSGWCSGKVGIDMIDGPLGSAVIADGSGHAGWIARSLVRRTRRRTINAADRY